MDESHHYRAKSSARAINDLNPVIGLELTATPQVQEGSRTILFKNVVYEYPLSKAILPVTTGVAIDVPSIAIVPFLTAAADSTFVPEAAIQ